jgi:hypothetical protein
MFRVCLRKNLAQTARRITHRNMECTTRGMSTIETRPRDLSQENRAASNLLTTRAEDRNKKILQRSPSHPGRLFGSETQVNGYTSDSNDAILQRRSGREQIWRRIRLTKLLLLQHTAFCEQLFEPPRILSGLHWTDRPKIKVHIRCAAEEISERE